MCVISIPVCTLAIIFRFIATRRSGRKPGLEDWFALAAWVTFMPFACTLLYGEWKSVIALHHPSNRVANMMPQS